MTENTLTTKENETALMSNQEMAQVMERVLLSGDLSKLDPADRVKYYRAVCQSQKLNPLTKPFEYLTLKDGNGGSKMVLYPAKGCTEQLRTIRKISITKLETILEDGLLKSIAYGTDGEGRSDVATGAIWIGGPNGNIKGNDLAVAHMKVETKSKRRLTLSMCGLGMMDESEIEDARNSNNYDQSPQVDNNLVRTALAKHVWEIGEAHTPETLKEVFGEGWKALKKLESREGGKEALTELNQAYLKKKNLLERTEAVEAEDATAL